VTKILITGGQGMLATEIGRAYSCAPGHDVQSPGRQDLDVTDAEAVRHSLKGARPSVVVHTAAMHVDACEEDPEGAYRLNAWATRVLARACEEQGCVFVYISTCGLFGDEVRAYNEYDEPVLKTVYAKSKYAGEIAVRETCRRHFVVRPGWLFGGDRDHSKNFVARRYDEARQSTVMRSAMDKHGSPTYTADLAERIRAVVHSGDYGTYHLANEGGATRQEYVAQIVQSFGLDTPVEGVDSSHYPRRADVPDCEILTSYNTRSIGLDLLPAWQEAVDRYVRSLSR
jgi:dTDP-4-dehydrorhamnose reductase